MNSIEYYDKNSKSFYNRTINADVQDLYDTFLKHLPQSGRILDAGCGVGRDAKFFMNKGYEVLAFDASIEMVKTASEVLKHDVHHMLFQDMHFSNEFDAVWANASLLHVPYENLRETLESFHKALRPAGVLFASFKYGSSMRQVEERSFFDMNEENIKQYLKGLFTPLEIWKSPDNRSSVAASPDKSWLNIIAKGISCS